MAVPLIPLRLLGVALARRTYMEKNGNKPLSEKADTFTVSYPRPRPKPVHTTREAGSIQNPLQNLAKGLSSLSSGLSSSLSNLTSTVSRIIQNSPKDDYDNIVKGYLPENATLLTPQYPANTDKFQMVDLDGDTQDELVTSYKHGNDIRTLVLKKNNGRWMKMLDISTPDNDTLSYRSFADITGEGKKQLLLGYRRKDHPNELHGYSINNGEASRLFTHKYSRFQIIDTTDNRSTPAKSHMAFWNKGETVLDKIEVKHWNGHELEPVNNTTGYYNKNVLPLYSQRVKQQPQDPTNWFKLADALTKAGKYRDALDSVNIGMSLNPVSPSKEDFLELKSMIMEKMKK